MNSKVFARMDVRVIPWYVLWRSGSLPFPLYTGSMIPFLKEEGMSSRKIKNFKNPIFMWRTTVCKMVRGQLVMSSWTVSLYMVDSCFDLFHYVEWVCKKHSHSHKKQPEHAKQAQFYHKVAWPCVYWHKGEGRVSNACLHSWMNPSHRRAENFGKCAFILVWSKLSIPRVVTNMSLDWLWEWL